MVQFRRLDPLANAGPFQRLMKSPVKSLSLTEAQFDRVKAQRPGLMALEGDAGVIGVPTRDLLEVHYAFPDAEVFRDNFQRLFNRIIEASSREEAPRGVVLSFRDRPNRNLADVVFWSLALNEGPEWVEMNHFAVPEQEEPSAELDGGHRVREAGAADAAAVRAVEAAATGNAPLTDAGIETLFSDARWVRLIEDGAGKPVGLLVMRTEPGSWGIIQVAAFVPEAASLREAVLLWAMGFLRNNGGRRVRRAVSMDQGDELALLRRLGFTAGETGLVYTRSVDPEEVRAIIEERQSHGTVIKFGDWR